MMVNSKIQCAIECLQKYQTCGLTLKGVFKYFMYFEMKSLQNNILKIFSFGKNFTFNMCENLQTKLAENVLDSLEKFMRERVIHSPLTQC